MNKKLKLVGAVAIFAIGAVFGNYAIKMLNPPPAPSTATQSLIGSPLPAFNMLGIDGVREHSKQWLGKVQIINFWATWCPPCKREIPALIELQQQHGREGLQIIGIALDNAEAVRQYADEAGINYPTLVGDDDAIAISEQMGNDMGILPYTLIVDRNGNITYVKYGEAEKQTIEDEIKHLL